MLKIERHMRSPNYTRGRPGPPRFIVIHWWGKVAWNQSLTGVARWLCKPRGNKSTSAHYVLEAGRVLEIVSPDNTAWHARAAGNPYGIGIECNPRMREGDLETAAQLIAYLWKIYGKLPLKGHKELVNTECPGTYQGKLNWLTYRANQIYQGAAHTTRAETVSAANQTKGKNIMKNIGLYYVNDQNRTVFMLINPGSGFCTEYTVGDKGAGGYNNPLARAFDTGSYVRITKSHAGALKRDLAKVRKGE